MIAERLDATLLKQGATLEEYDRCIQQALSHGCRGLILPTSIFDDSEANLQRYRFQDGTRMGTVIGFPLGHSAVKEKWATMEQYAPYVDEFDIVLNIGWMKSGYWEYVKSEIEWLTRPSKYPYTMKFIIEAPVLTGDEIFSVVGHVVAAHQQNPQVRYIKTATGFHGNTEVSHVKAIRNAIGNGVPDLGIKVSGGIRTLEQIQEMDPYDVGIYGVGYPHFEELIVEEQRRALHV